ncbi:DUF748 domain-containing protein [Methylomicrobium sp. RS1]|jgi:outer membrane protein OmpA-like peptidoglycan-associated protein|uniref:DUF748 domain-containing protein n=1 Tax=Candidatus Methylomicrobium oryzae TaxID=2802053 RepID=UPI00192426C3|nr:DUF748 domain-containing protein [Methylomicrobium sp. RS1]MBL1265449.1 DUF748 domain-containing protein [Methylomicrobium sp. RS1]
MKARTLLTKILKGLAIAASIVLLYALAGFYAVPYLVKSKAPTMIKELTGRGASIAKVELNPFSFRMSVQGFALQEKNGQLFAGFERFAANLELWRSLKESALTIDDVQLLKPSVRLARFKNGQFNFADLLADKEEPQPKSERALFPVQIGRLVVADGKLLWEDEQSGKPVKEEVVPIGLTVEQFSLAQNQPFSLHLKMALKSGGTLDWQGEAGIEPLFSKGRLTLDQLKLQNLTGIALPQTVSFTLQGDEVLEAEYRVNYSAAKGLALEIPKSRFELKDFAYASAETPGLAAKSSTISLEAGYKIIYTGRQWQVAAEKAEAKLRDVVLTGFAPAKAALKIPEIVMAAACDIGNEKNGFNVIVRNGQAALRGSEFSENPQDQPLVKIGSLAGEGIDLNLLQRAVSINTIKSENADIQAWLTREGKLNYLALRPENGKPATAEKPVPPPEKHIQPWKIALKSAALTGFGVNFEDRTGSKPVAVQVKPIDLTLRDFTNAEGAKLPVQLSAGFNQHGRIKLDGDVVISPFIASLNVAVADIALDRFQAYVDRFARLDVIDGGFFAEGKLDIQFREQPDVKFRGLAGVEELVTRDQLQNKDFIKWRKLTLNGIDADLSANRYTAKRLLIEKPYARVVIRKNKTVNVNEVLSTGHDGSKSAASATPKQQDAGRKPYFRLDQALVHDGSSDFADLSLILPFAAEIKELNGGASGFSSEKKSNVKVSLKGNAYDLAPVDVQGEVSPYRGEYDVELSFHGLPMPLISPYMVQFAGYKVEKGKLNLDLKYRVEKGALTASNNILIDQFELGEKVENPNAVSLPLDLAVALLKDSDNRIKLDVPITGSLEDPKFSIRALVADALVNALKKVIASPFKAVASLFKDGENLDHIDFKAGKAELDQAQLAKLDNLAKALKERPALNLEIKGAAYVEQDWPALKDAALYDRLKSLKAAELAKKGKKVRVEYIELSDDEYKDYLAQMFIEKFPLLAERSLFGKPRLVDEKAGDFYEVAKQKLFTIIKPEVERLKDLAAKRAQAIAKHVVQQGGIPPERVFILDTAINPEREGQGIVTRLSLKAH